MYHFNQFSQQPTIQRYVVHEDFRDTPFQLNSSSRELFVNESLQKEGMLSMYDIVIVADQGQNEAWTVTTVIIGEFFFIHFKLQNIVTSYSSKADTVSTWHEMSFGAFKLKMQLVIVDVQTITEPLINPLSYRVSHDA